MLPSGLTWGLWHFCGIFYKSVYFFLLISNIDTFTFDEGKKVNVLILGSKIDKVFYTEWLFENLQFGTTLRSLIKVIPFGTWSVLNVRVRVHYLLKMCKFILHVKSMQLSLIFWQHFWGQARSCLPCHLPYSTLHLPNSPWFLQKYVKLDQKSWKSAQTSRRVNPMAASFHALYLLPQLNSARSSRHNTFCRVERVK